jgi:hypothetical protein
MQKYRKKPVVIEAMQWTGTNVLDLWDWAGANNVNGPLPVHDALRPEGKPCQLWVEANKAWLDLEIGEWILKDALGYYPCKDSIFSTTYEPVTSVTVDVSNPQGPSAGTCGVCGQPMPEGEEMFAYHGFSGPCPEMPTRDEVE